MFNNKRKSTTFLKIKDGKVVDIQDPYKTDDIDENENKEFYEENKRISSEKKKPKNKKGFILLIIGLLFIIIPIGYMSFSVLSSQLGDIKDYMEQEEPTTENDNSNVSNEDIDENIKDIITTTNIVNASFQTSYNNFKEDITSLLSNKISLYEARGNLKLRYDILNKNKSIIENKISLFETPKEKELYSLYQKRFNLLSNTLSPLTEDINRSTVVEILNTSIKEDNILLNEEITLLKEILEDNNVDYIENENGISLRE